MRSSPNAPRSRAGNSAENAPHRWGAQVEMKETCGHRTRPWHGRGHRQPPVEYVVPPVANLPLRSRSRFCRETLLHCPLNATKFFADAWVAAATSGRLHHRGTETRRAEKEEMCGSEAGQPASLPHILLLENPEFTLPALDGPPCSPGTRRWPHLPRLRRGKCDHHSLTFFSVPPCLRGSLLGVASREPQ